MYQIIASIEPLYNSGKNYMHLKLFISNAILLTMDISNSPARDFSLSLGMRQAFPQYIGAQRWRGCRLRLPRELGRVQTGRGRVDQLHACMPLEPKAPHWALRAAVSPNFKSAPLAARTCSVRWVRRYSLVSMLVSALSKTPRTPYRFRARAKPSLPWPCYGDTAVPLRAAVLCLSTV